MSTFIDFTPSTLVPFQFQPTLNDTQYVVTVQWNAFGQRYYISVTDLSGNLILSRSLVSGGPSIQSSLVWADGVVTATASLAHNIPVGSIAIIRISNSNSGFDGTYAALSVDAMSMNYSLLTNPKESAPIIGTLNFDLDLLGGYGIGSMFFQDATQQFEF